MLYHKINSIFKRDMTLPNKPMIMGDYSTEELAYLANNQWLFTEKVDGTNMRVMWDGASVTFGGRTDNANISSPLLNRLNERFIKRDSPLFVDLALVFGATPAIMYGEGYGAGIQKGGGYRKDQDFILFDIFIENFWLKQENVEEIAGSIGIPFAPVVGVGTLLDGVDLVKGGMKSLLYDGPSEGIIAKPVIQMFNRKGERIITKIKCVDWKA